MKFLLYLIWQIIKIPLSVLSIPFLILFVVLLYPIAFIWHHYEVFKGKRSSYLGVFDIE